MGVRERVTDIALAIFVAALFLQDSLQFISRSTFQHLNNP
jgi:hypothetical protein